MNFYNLAVAAAAFGIIGIFHPIVIKTEYYIGTGAWPLFAAAGTLFLVLSVITNGVPGILCAVTGCAWFWSILELFEQKTRVEKGWFPKRQKPLKSGRAVSKERQHGLSHYSRRRESL